MELNSNTDVTFVSEQFIATASNQMSFDASQDVDIEAVDLFSFRAPSASFQAAKTMQL